MTRPKLEQILDAAARIAPYLRRTPVYTSSSLDAMSGATLFFKCENLQKAGAFKARGATNAVFSLTDREAEPGVATHSSGNHAAALALAARLRGIKAYVVMPENAPAVKQRAVAGYGAEIARCRPTLAAREEKLREVIARTGAAVVHPYDDERVIAGQGTAALELCDEVPDLDVVIAPVGGGGLLSGTALAVRGVSPGTCVLGAEPEMADDAFRSMQAGRIIPSAYPETVADGLRTSLGELTFPIIQQYVDAIVTVSEADIIAAMRLTWERMKLLIEPSAAVPLAAILSGRAVPAGKRVGIILSGGNVDLDTLPWRQK
jgi:threonine dehydratase